MRTFPMVLGLLLAVTITSCGTEPRAEELGSDAAILRLDPGQAPATDDVVSHCESLGLDVLRAGGEKNVVFSPSSACTALGTLTAGTSGVARTELEALLGASGEDLQRSFNALLTDLNGYEADPATVNSDEIPERPVLHQANNVVIDQGFEVQPGYLDALRRYYDSGMQRAELDGSEGKAVLDAWVKQHTGGRIEKSAITADPSLRLVLQDAVLFAAQWAQQFDEGATRPIDFTRADGEQVSVDALYDTRDLSYATGQGWQAAIVPFSEGFEAMLVLPPADQPNAIIDDALLDQLRTTLTTEQVALTMPKFRLSSVTDVRPVLRAAGVQAIFDDSQDPLRGINPTAALYVHDIVQQATIDVDAAGAVAAAVTEISVRETSVPVSEVELRLDRPFMMTIVRTGTNLGLFQVAVRDPAVSDR